MPKPFRFEQTGDRQTNQLQDNIKAATNTLRGSPFGDGNLVKDIALTGTYIEVNHGLGRPHQGWIVCRLRSANWNFVFETSTTDATVTLASYDFGTADIWFY
jgi:hypothetical protein